MRPARKAHCLVVRSLGLNVDLQMSTGLTYHSLSSALCPPPALKSLASPGQPLQKAPSPLPPPPTGPVPPSLLRHPNLDAYISRASAESLPSYHRQTHALGEPWPLPLATKTPLLSTKSFPSCPWILILLMLFASLLRAGRLGAGCWVLS